MPAIGLLFLQNYQVQTAVSEYMTKQLAEDLGVKINLSAVRYNFFKRLHVYDLMIGDQSGDTLIYSEMASLRLKKFRPDRQDIRISYIRAQNSLLNIAVDSSGENNMEFLVEHFRREIPPYEKVILDVGNMSLEDSEFRFTNMPAPPSESGIDFSQLRIRQLNATVEDFLFRWDTVYLSVMSASGIDRSGFVFDQAEMNMSIGKTFLNFQNATILAGPTVARVPETNFAFTDIRNFKYVYDSVEVSIISRNSYLDFTQIAYFFPPLKNLSGAILLDGQLSGTLGNLSGKGIKIRSGDSTYLEMNMRLNGLPDTDRLAMNFAVDSFTTQMNDIRNIFPRFAESAGVNAKVPEKAGLINYRGNFAGTIKNFKTDGRLNSEYGEVNFDLVLQPDTTGQLKYSGLLEARDFKAGSLLDLESTLGKTNLSVRVDGEYVNESFNAVVLGNVRYLEMYGYSYKNIDLNGRLSNKQYSGSLEIRDPNIDLKFNGSLDFESEIPRMRFNLDVANLRPYYLGLNNDDPEYFASFFLETDLEGIRIDDLNGEIRLINSLFRKSDLQIQMYDLALQMQNNPDSSYLRILSDYAEANLYGNYKLSVLPSVFKNMLNTHFRVFETDTTPEWQQQQFTYDIELKRTAPLISFFIPEIEIDDNCRVHGNFGRIDDQVKHQFQGYIPRIGFAGVEAFDMNIRSGFDSTLADLVFSADSLLLAGEYRLADPKMEFSIFENTTTSFTTWNNHGTPQYAGALSTEGHLINDSLRGLTYLLHIDPSWIIYNDKNFDIAASTVELAKKSIGIDSLSVSGEGQYLLANGRYSGLGEQEISVIAENIKLPMISNILFRDLLALDGRVSGNATITNEKGNPIILSTLEVDSLYVNRALIGNTQVNANWLEANQSLQVSINAKRKDIRSLTLDGLYFPETGNLDFNVGVNSLNIQAFSPYLKSALEQVSGYADIHLTVDGTVNNPLLNGQISLYDTDLIVSSTKTRYRFSNGLRVYNNNVFIENLRIEDQNGNIAMINGNLTNNRFKDFHLNLELSAQNFNFLNTTQKDNEQFYGTVFASADATLSGPVDRLHFDVNARTERNTALKLPLYNPEEVKSKDFITFISRSEEDTVEPEIEEIKRAGVTLEMDLQITSGAGVQMIFDPNVGDIIDASGSGNLKIEMDENQNITILGDVMIEEGDYLFTLQNVINKRFKVSPGGRITWSGSPADAVIDLDAIYETKAAPYNLSPQPEESMKRRIPVYCVLSLEGDLMNPLISPGIEMPTAEPETKTLLQNNTGTDEELMKQFISLLVLNNFLSSEGLGGVVTGGLNTAGVAGVTASELVSNQLSNWLSQISNDFDIGINYRPGDEISSDEVEVALSTQLFDERIILSGNVDVGGNQVNAAENSATSIVGDFDLEFRVSDRISVKAYNRANDDFILRNSLYTQGVGVFYRNEFDNFSNLFKRKDRDKNNSKKRDEVKPENEAILRDDRSD